MKRIVKISLVLLIMIFMTSSVFAALSCKISMQASKTQLEKDEEFVVSVNLSDMETDGRGIIAIKGHLEYDKDSLELVKMEGKNGWATPSYNEQNGELVSDRANPATGDETVFEITFKVTQESKQNLVITLNNITVGNGAEPTKVSYAYENLTVNGGTQNEVPTPTPDTNTDNDNNDNNSNNNNNNNGTVNNNESNNTNNNIANNGSSSSNSSNNKNNNGLSTNNSAIANKTNTVSTVKNLPQTGMETTIIPILMLMTFIAIGIIYVKNRKVNKQIKDMNKEA